MYLKPGTTLQGGKYKIEKKLGQGGFGITYLAAQEGLNRKVAIKEFFMKDFCNRSSDTSFVSVPSVGSQETVEKFRGKFIKEAQTIAGLVHGNIIRIYDIFEENGTAYYTMEYHQRGSLSDLLKKNGSLPESEALVYIRQLASALEYIHARKMNHLDVKPGNVLLSDGGEAILIDFGMTKRYNRVGHQTSVTPVGVSKGYAPIEQYKEGGVSNFSPQSDIYSLGATFYKLLTGITPPEAPDLQEQGFSIPANLSGQIKKAISQSMQVWRKDRPQNIPDFLKILNGSGGAEKNKTASRKVVTSDDEVTVLSSTPSTPPKPPKETRVNRPTEKSKEPNRNSVPPNTPASVAARKSSSSSSSSSGLWCFLKKINPWIYIFLGVIIVSFIWDAVEGNVEEPTVEVYDTNDGIKEEYVDLSGTLNGYEWVDLGLPSGLKWASCNVGASSPEDYGDYFAWGETRPKSEYSWSTYKLCHGTYDTQTKYNNNNFKENYTLSLEDDAARQNWHSSWRIPTKDEWLELREHCTWTWTTYKDVEGMLVYGPAGTCIFLPAAGYADKKNISDMTAFGGYWSASRSEENTYNAGISSFHSGKEFMKNKWQNVYRCRGYSVRPVSDK